MNKNIYELKIHESVTIISEVLDGVDRFNVNYIVTRVPGGWLYKRNLQNIPPVFVPFSNEFQ